MRKKRGPAKPPHAKKKSVPANKNQMMEEEDEMEEGIKPSVFVPGRHAIDDDESLQYDPTAYDCMSSMSLEWPSLSFDIVADSLGDDRRAFPHTMFMVAGTQAASSKLNYLAVMKVSNLTQGKHGAAAATKDKKKKDGAAEGSDSDDDMSEDSDSDEDEDAKLHVKKIAHTGGINRVRSMPQQPHVVASWADTAQVQIWDLSQQLTELANEAEPAPGSGKIIKVNARQVHSHSAEGYALDWSPLATGRLASGDCRSKIHIWDPTPAGKWAVGGAMKGHEASVEDIQWSPTEATVFASCSVDKTIRIWDTRETSKAMLAVTAHETDVNVIAWNKLTAYMLASGGDDGALKVWDLRQFTPAAAAPVASFTHHRGPVTSVEWCPHEASMLLTTSSDNTLGVWDLAVERDPEEEAALGAETNVAAPEDLPAQLLFLHAGQNDLKEGHWHRQIPGMVVTTAADGFNIFKPANV